MNIIRARFMHQHRNKAVYERDIVLDTPTLNQYYGRPTTYLEFEMPLLWDIEPAFVRRWYKRYIETYRNTYVTRRVLRFVNSDGTILCELPERRLKANFHIPLTTDISSITELPTIHICCIVEKDEIKELAKIFFPKYFVE